jgi:hypothetical protein
MLSREHGAKSMEFDFLLPAPCSPLHAEKVSDRSDHNDEATRRTFNGRQPLSLHLC